eukprot:3332008-Pyramimonas_sp.AAC.1
MAPLQDGCASMASRVSSPDAKRAQWVAARSTSVGLVDESCASSCCLPAHAKGAVRREQQKYTPIRTGTRWVFCVVVKQASVAPLCWYRHRAGETYLKLAVGLRKGALKRVLVMLLRLCHHLCAGAAA